jgi:DNA-binding GntR family transcriptional regulator
VIDLNSDRSRPRQLADLLRARIASGQYASGIRLPSEQHLSQEFGLHRTTVRRALDILRGEGLIETRRPTGTFVWEAPAEQIIELASGALVRARMPTPEERRRLDIVEGVPVLVVDHDGDTMLYAGDRFVLWRR